MEGDLRRMREVQVLEGNVPLPVQPKHRLAWAATRVGEHDVLRDNDRRELYWQPTPHMQIYGSEAALSPILEAQSHNGLPCADLMSLMSRPAVTFAGYAIDLSHPVMGRGMLAELFPQAEWPEGESPSFLCARANVTGDIDDPHIEIEATLRHTREGDGLDVTEAAADALLARLREEPRLRTLRPLLAKVEKRRNRGDLVLVVDLGRARQVVGLLAPLALPLFMPVVQAARVIEVQVEEPPPPPPPPEPKKG
jgi:hypothetical protein